jgi:hypothetical protein
MGAGLGGAFQHARAQTLARHFEQTETGDAAHLNAGAVRRPLTQDTAATWGIGSETRLNQRLQLIAETYGDSKSRGFYHLGLRFWVIPDRVQVDTTFGNRWGTETGERWVSVGLRLLSPAFLP